MIKSTMKPFKKNLSQQGVTLLEVLIAIIVFSVGMLGMLGLLANGMKMTTSSQYRTIAAQQLTAMADMITANPNLADKYAPPTSTITANCLKAAGCAGANTDPLVAALNDASYATLPNTEYGLWRANVANLLPNGAGMVCLDATPADGNSGAFACSGAGRTTVKICWNENARVKISGGGSSGTDASTDTCLSTQL